MQWKKTVPEEEKKRERGVCVWGGGGGGGRMKMKEDKEVNGETRTVITLRPSSMTTGVCPPIGPSDRFEATALDSCK